MSYESIDRRIKQYEEDSFLMSEAEKIKSHQFQDACGFYVCIECGTLLEYCRCPKCGFRCEATNHCIHRRNISSG